MSRHSQVLVSACLVGAPCRYDGASRPDPEALVLLEEGRALPLCPEQLGGLPAPRKPCELMEGRVLTPEGDDLTEPFVRGAHAALELAQRAGCRKALLKSLSPSCGGGAHLRRNLPGPDR